MRDKIACMLSFPGYSLVLAALNTKLSLLLVWKEVEVQVDHFHLLPTQQLIGKLENVKPFKITAIRNQTVPQSTAHLMFPKCS